MLKFFKNQHILRNTIAGITVSFIGLSLGAAFGVMSGRGALVGILSASLIAFVTSLFGGTRIQCSGPTGPMSAMTALIVSFAYDKIPLQFPGINPDHFINIVLFLTGALIIILGVLRLGKLISLIPNIVISGFMDGIAVMILLSQVKVLFGLWGTPSLAGTLSTNLAVVAISLVLLFYMPQLLQKVMKKWSSLISGTLITIVFMTAVSAIFELQIERINISSILHSWADFSSMISLQWPATCSWKILFAALPFAIHL